MSTRTPRVLAIKLLQAKKMSEQLRCPDKKDRQGYGKDHYLAEMAFLHVELRDKRLQEVP
jgi:hypothetical protein